MGQLRITSGELRNRRVEVPETGGVRPMLEKPRMAIFSILGQDFAAKHTAVDCFAGTGILALEALSRGASSAVLFDTDAVHVQEIRNAAAKLGVAGRIRTFRADVMRELVAAADGRVPAALHGLAPARLVFVDPPHVFGTEKGHPFHGWFAALGDLPGLAADAVVAYGHHAKLTPPEASGRLKRQDTRTYGEVGFSLYWE